MARQEYDLAVVGAGIVGLGLAAAAHERGLEVVVVERAPGIVGASVRNFGHLGFAVHTGLAGEYAARSRELWLRLAARTGLWLRRAGTLLVARGADELEVLRDAGQGRRLTAAEVGELAPVVGAAGGLHLPDDLQVDPRAAAPAIAAHLAAAGVDFRWRTSAFVADAGVLHTSRGELRAGAIVWAVGADVDQVHPALAEAHGVERCALDMLLADGVGLTVPLLTATSMLRYSAFAATPAAAAVRERLGREEPELLARDVNQMHTERPDGTLVIGDTHEVADQPPPFQDEAAHELLRRVTRELFGREPRIRQRWQGVYAKAPGDFLRAAPADGVRVVTVTSGIGMTTGLGLAESVIDELFGGAA